MVQILVFGVQGLVFRVWGVWFSVQGLLFSVLGLLISVQGLGFSVQILVFGVQGLVFTVQDLGFRVQYLGFSVQCLGISDQVLGFKVYPYCHISNCPENIIRYRLDNFHYPGIVRVDLINRNVTGYLNGNPVVVGWVMIILFKNHGSNKCKPIRI